MKTTIKNFSFVQLLRISYYSLQLKKMIDLKQIDSDWTLFLDRDGVINHEKYLDYIHKWEEFVFYEGVKEAIQIFAQKFRYIFVVTNQKGVARGLTKEADLLTIHRNMADEIAKAGGRIDKVYYCGDLDETSPNRKPNPGMGLQAKKEFPLISFDKAIMVGNTLGDMEFGRNLGTKTVFLPTTKPNTDLTDSRIDAVYPSLFQFATAL